MTKHRVVFSPSGRCVQVDEKTTILRAAQIASEPISAECNGPGACKFSGDRVGKALRKLAATDRISHRTVIVPGHVSVISGELEDVLGEGWRVLTGPQEASDITPLFRDVWSGYQ
ncbi:MAG: hypothetical protein AB1714_24240 [Acidobacteriota bacterium]